MELDRGINKSRIIVSLDFADKRFLDSIDSYSQDISGVKIGLPSIIEYGTDFLAGIRKTRLYILADFKLADIPAVMIRTIDILSKFVDGIIMHPFVGTHAVKKVANHSHSLGIDVFLVVSMTHMGAEEFINRHFDDFVSIADKYADGVVAPATYPRLVRTCRKILGYDKIILSPGVGAQGAPFGSGISNGADYEIIGRSITLSKDPLSTIRRINEIHSKVMKQTIPPR